LTLCILFIQVLCSFYAAMYVPFRGDSTNHNVQYPILPHAMSSPPPNHAETKRNHETHQLIHTDPLITLLTAQRPLQQRPLQPQHHRKCWQMQHPCKVRQSGWQEPAPMTNQWRQRQSLKLRRLGCCKRKACQQEPRSLRLVRQQSLKLRQQGWCKRKACREPKSLRLVRQRSLRLRQRGWCKQMA
jgi:hypothetical protein